MVLLDVKKAGLFAAVECGDIKKIEQYFLSRRLFENVFRETDYRGRTGMHLAVEHGQEEAVDRLLAQGGINLSTKDCGGFTALHLACELGRDTIVEQLLENCDVKLIREKAKHSGLTCLHLAVIRGHVKVVELLLAIAPDLMNVEDTHRRSPLHFAVENEHEEIIAMLMESTHVETVFHSAIRAGHGKSVSQFLDLRPQLIDAVDDCGKSPLYLAAEEGRHSIVKQLFARRQPRLAPVGGACKMSLLHLAAKYGYDTIVAELLVEQPHLIDDVDEFGTTALLLAVEKGHGKIVGQLLAHKPEVIDANDSEGRTALHCAVASDNVELVEQLLAHKPELIDDTGDCGDTPLMLALNEERPQVVVCLLAHGPAVIEKEFLWDSLNIGDSELSSQAVKLIRERKPELMASGNNVLHFVFGFDKDEGENSQLLSKKIDEKTVWQLSPPHVLRAANSEGDTPFHVAVKSYNDFAIKLVQTKRSLDEIAAAYAKCKQKAPLAEFLARFQEPLFVALNKDIVGTVSEYLGVERPKKRMRGSRPTTKAEPQERRNIQKEVGREAKQKNECVW